MGRHFFLQFHIKTVFRYILKYKTIRSSDRRLEGPKRPWGPNKVSSHLRRKFLVKDSYICFGPYYKVQGLIICFHAYQGNQNIQHLILKINLHYITYQLVVDEQTDSYIAILCRMVNNVQSRRHLLCKIIMVYKITMLVWALL